MAWADDHLRGRVIGHYAPRVRAHGIEGQELADAWLNHNGRVGCGDPTGPFETVRMMAISVKPPTPSRHMLTVDVSPDRCGMKYRLPVSREPDVRSLSKKLAHHSAGSHAALQRRGAGNPARQMSPMSWNGNHKLTTGMIQPQNVQPRALRCGHPRCSALIRARWNHTTNMMLSPKIATSVILS